MAKEYVIYNQLAGNGQADAKLLQFVLDEALMYYDITRTAEHTAFNMIGVIFSNQERA
jgi:hypothetical protein